MLSVEPDDLWQEIQAAERFRDLHLDSVKEMVQHYTGYAYRSDWKRGGWSENHQYEFIRLVTGKIIFDNPKTRIQTRRPGTQRLIAQAMQHGMNRWVRDVKLRRLLKRLFVSECFAYSVGQVTVEPQPWMDPREPSIRYWPNVYQLDQDRFFFDPLSRWFGSARYVGHKWVRDKKDILDEAEGDNSKGWNREAIQEMSEDVGVESLSRDESRRGGISRKEIVGYEVWVPEIHTKDPSDGFHGTIYTIAAAGARSHDQEAQYIRKPRPFYGPRWGPYVLFGVYPVPGDPYPLSPFSAVYSQMRELNDIVAAINKSIREYKRITFVSADNPDLAKKLKDSPDAFIVPVKGFKKDDVVSMESAGITPNHVQQLAQALERMDRNSGISDPQRGNVVPRATATAIAVSDAASTDMISFIKQEFTDSVVQVLDSCGWYMYHDDRVKFPLGEEAAAELGLTEPWFIGGSHGEESGARYDDLELEIEPYSMQRMNEALAQAQYKEMMEVAINAAGIIPQAPFYDWKMLFDKGGEVLNDPRFGDFFDPQIAEAFAGALARQQQPRTEFSKQTGGRGLGRPSTTTRTPLLGEQRGRQIRKAQRLVKS